MKKFLSVILVFIICLIPSLTGCKEEHIHTYSEKTSVPTCTSQGTITYICDCGDSYVEYIQQLNHTYNCEVATSKYLKSNATCTSKAIYYKSCSCGKAGTSTFEYGSMLEHTVVIDKGVDATCTKTGLTEGSHCSVCNQVLLEQTVIPERHQYKDATCTDPMECILCGATYGLHNGHSFSGNYCTSCGLSIYDIFDYEYYSGNYSIGDRNYIYGTAYITNCSHTYYKYNNSLTMVVNTKATISGVYPGTSGIISYKVCLYKNSVLFDSKICSVSGKKGTSASNSVSFYNITPGVYEIKIVKN